MFVWLSWIVSFQVIGYILGSMNQSSVTGWYQTLYKSSLTPSGYVFGIVWPVLYVCLALVGYHIWQDKKSCFCLKIFFVLQMILNWSWTIIFFHCQALLLSWITIGLMILLTAILLAKTYKNKPYITILLVPYFIWICFAFYLSVYIWIYNA
ncbi:MAG: tryptophan-rich sensory protein [Epsilonproteobacteria bacterium]|nr:tryptophan-rich sensory protein [Campylobacterota bacterium]|tara:strand:+ start:9589 stop:10044 length:456 start_codon:yes stop_codon:yes gene_type:complete